MRFCQKTRRFVARRRLLLEIGGVHLLGGPDLTLVDPFGEAQRVERLVQVVLPRRQVDEHQRLGVAAERVDEEVGELRIPVGYVSVLEKWLKHGKTSRESLLAQNEAGRLDF